MGISDIFYCYFIASKALNVFSLLHIERLLCVELLTSILLE